jgi:GNAT superfamily N-acetyltransferase
MENFGVLDAINPEDLAFLEKGLAENAAANGAPPYTKHDLVILARGNQEKIIAGLTGKTFWNWLYIDILWVEAEHRKQGFGSRLVQEAETEAIKRGCHSSYLWTENYEGRNFYPKLGYKEFVEKQDFPNGFQRIGFMKRLAA